MVTETPGKERIHNLGICVPSAAQSTKHSIPSVLSVCRFVALLAHKITIKVAAREGANCLGILQVRVKVR